MVLCWSLSALVNGVIIFTESDDTNHSFIKSVQAPSQTSCALKCKRYSICNSISYDKISQHCQLLKKDKDGTVEFKSKQVNLLNTHNNEKMEIG